MAPDTTGLKAAFTLGAFFRESFHVESDPADLVYKQRYAAELVDSFRVLSLLVFATMTFLFSPARSIADPDDLFLSYFGSGGCSFAARPGVGTGRPAAGELRFGRSVWRCSNAG
jgi:hypothetical protein